MIHPLYFLLGFVLTVIPSLDFMDAASEGYWYATRAAKYDVEQVCRAKTRFERIDLIGQAGCRIGFYLGESP